MKECKSGQEVYVEVENIVSQLYSLPNVIQILVENYELDSANKDIFENKYSRMVAKDNIYSVLMLIHQNISRMIEEIESLDLNKSEE